MEQDQKIFFVASDHAGFELKNQIRDYLKSLQLTVIDLGSFSNETSSYVDYGQKLGQKITEDPEKFVGFAVCGTGIGICCALNRFSEVRAARICSIEDSFLAKLHNNANVLCFGGRQQSILDVKKMIAEFLQTEFEGGRHEKRILQLKNIKENR